MIAWKLFTHPMTLSSTTVLFLLIPLCLSVGIVYKTLRVDDIRKLPREIPWLILYLFGGLLVLCGALWGIYSWFA